MIGLKKLETRGRRTHVRGRIAIHAALKRTSAQRDLFEEWLADYERSIFAAFEDALELDFDSMQFGEIIGTVDLVDCVLAVESVIIHPRERLLGNYELGRWIWKLKDPVRFTRSISFKGRQGWFEVPDSLLAQ